MGLDFQERERRWRKIANAFGLSLGVSEPERCGLPSEFGAVLVLEGVGAPKGMVLLPNGTAVMRYSDDIIARGYGFSVLDPTALVTSADRLSVDALLRDWGYSQ